MFCLQKYQLLREEFIRITPREQEMTQAGGSMGKESVEQGGDHHSAANAEKGGGQAAQGAGQE